MTIRRLTAALVLMLCASMAVFAQKKASKDSLIRLLQADSARQYDMYGMQIREVKGNQVTFLHNDTYLLCDSAKWNVDANMIDAYGHVQIVQNQTRLTSESLTYLIDESLAKFRGGVVELTDKAGNLLRTDQLDYNTKDSVALFYYGAAMRDTSGNVMESVRGNFDAKINTFTFENRVELYTDTSFLKTDILRYVTDQERAYFSENTYAFRGDGFVKANGGWFDTRNHILSFNNDVFMDNPDYEAWANEVYYYQDSSYIEMRDMVQILDTADKTVIFAERAQYDQTTGSATIPELPVLIYYGENEEHQIDTLFMRADTLRIYPVKRNEIPQEEIDEAAKRKEDMLYDYLTVQREEQAKKRQDEWVSKMKEYGKLPQDYNPEDPEGLLKRAADSLAAIKASLSADSLNAVEPVTDTLGYVADQFPSEEPISGMETESDSVSVVDSTLIRYICAYHDVKLYRSDIQAKCDSLVFCELDSIARMFNRPVLWNAGKNQLSSNTMQLLLQDGSLTRGAMLENAMITTQEDTLHYNQIKSTEMSGYFNGNELYRFDALGGVNAIFYLVEDHNITSLNLKEARAMTAVIKDGNAEKLLYTETIKSDAYPVSDLDMEKQRLTGFEWRGDERPLTRFEITHRQVRPSERDKYINITKPTYRYVNKFFDNCMVPLVRQYLSDGQHILRKLGEN